MKLNENCLLNQMGTEVENGLLAAKVQQLIKFKGWDCKHSCLHKWDNQIHGKHGKCSRHAMLLYMRTFEMATANASKRNKKQQYANVGDINSTILVLRKHQLLYARIFKVRGYAVRCQFQSRKRKRN